mgnify:CR=1 FL=1
MIYFPDNDKSKMYQTSSIKFQEGGNTYSISNANESVYQRPVQPGEGFSTIGGNTFKMKESGDLTQTDTDFGGATTKVGGMISGLGGAKEILSPLVGFGKQLFGKGSAEGQTNQAQGALQGASQGAMAGSKFGIVGTVIGGTIGGLAGAVGAKKNEKALEEQEDKEAERLLLAEGKQGATDAEQKRIVSQKYLAQANYGMKTPSMYQQGGSLDNPRLKEYAPNFEYKSGGYTKGSYSHKTNPLTVIDKYGNDTGMELTGGEGVYDKMAQDSMENAIKNKNYAKAGMIVENEIKDWKRRGMY